MLPQIMYVYTFIFVLYIFLSYNQFMDFKEHLYQSLPKDEVDQLIDSFSNEDYHAVLLNLNKISDEEFLEEFPLVKSHPIVKHAYLYDKNVYPLGKHIYHELGYYYLQEPSAMVVSSLIDFKESDLVLDMCAAPGGKTIQVALKMNNQGLVIANDLSFSRCGLISNNLERLGLRNVIIINNDLSKIYQRYLNTFDKIILDAPCSGSGMFRKNDEMMKDWSINKVYKFQEIQKSLIEIAYQMLKPGGLLSYSTCSYSKEEDEDVIQYLLDRTDAEVVDISKYGYTTTGIRLMPSHFEGEGQYICQIRKPGQSSPTTFDNENKFKSLLADSYKNYDAKKVNDYLFSVSNSINLPLANIYRYGVKVGEFKKDLFKYDLHYARTLKANEMPTIELSSNELNKYLAGEQLNKESNQKGFALLTYKNNAVDIAKSDTRVIKNNYPKGLRKKF